MTRLISIPTSFNPHLRDVHDQLIAMRKQARKRGLLAARRGQLQVRARAVDILDILVQVPLSLALSLSPSLALSVACLRVISPPGSLSPWLSLSLALSLSPWLSLFLVRPRPPLSPSLSQQHLVCIMWSCSRLSSPYHSVPLGPVVTSAWKSLRCCCRSSGPCCAPSDASRYCAAYLRAPLCV